MRNDRRRPEAAKLRIYFDAIKDVETMSNEEWINQWIHGSDIETPFLPKAIWLDQLKAWALEEASKLANEAA